jgi:hypothetical protein
MGNSFHYPPRNYVSVVRDELIVLHSALSAVGASAPLDKSSNAGHQRLITSRCLIAWWSSLRNPFSLGWGVLSTGSLLIMMETTGIALTKTPFGVTKPSSLEVSSVLYKRCGRQKVKTNFRCLIALCRVRSTDKAITPAVSKLINNLSISLTQ